MSVTLDALYIFDDHNDCVLEHVYSGRPPTSTALITSLLAKPTPRPSIQHLADLAPPTTAYSITHSALTFIATSSKDAQSLALLDFLHRVLDIFEDFLGAPLLSSKIEENYEIIAQLLGEMCDGGVVCNTEPNALRESVEVTSTLGQLFTKVGLPGSSPALSSSSTFSSTLRPTFTPTPTLNAGPAIPWRRPNIRHTSNELYVDIIESLHIISAPSGRLISARAHGSVLFTAKISGVPDLLLVLTAPGGTSSAKTAGISRTMQTPVFHPCVRLVRWKDHPGEMSFVPPDGKFMLAGYETDLMPNSLNTDEPPSSSEKIFMPATVDLRGGLGVHGNEFEARLSLNNNFPGIPSVPVKTATSRTASGALSSLQSLTGPGSGSSGAPTLDNVSVTIPLPEGVRSVTELKASRGEASFNALERVVEWRVPTKGEGSIGGTATLRGTISGPFVASSGFEDEDEEEEEPDAEKGKAETMAGYYDSSTASPPRTRARGSTNGAPTTAKRTQAHRNKALMPRSISTSFNVKGWIPSGIKVESLNVDVKKSKGLGDGVRPYKGVKYLCVSRRGVERRVE